MANAYGGELDQTRARTTAMWWSGMCKAECGKAKRDDFYILEKVPSSNAKPSG